MSRMERNPTANRFVSPAGYIDLGWQVHAGNCDKVAKCQELKHKIKEFDNSLYRFRCTDVITICDECKTVYHINMSD